MILFTSDLHLGHKAIPKYRTPFSTMKEHDDYIIDKIVNLGKRDILYVLGDFLFDGPHYNEYIERLSKKRCRIKVVMGNHDSLKLYTEPIFEVQHPLYTYKDFWLSHCPIHPCEMRNRKGNIHGHLHLERVKNVAGEQDDRYFNANLDVNDYQFVDFDVIR